MTAIIRIPPSLQFGGGQDPLRFQHRAFPMDPLRFEGIEPGASAGQPANHEAYSLLRLLDELIMGVKPVLYGLASMPRGVMGPDRWVGR